MLLRCTLRAVAPAFTFARGALRVLTESEVQRSFRQLMTAGDLSTERFEQAEVLLDQLRAESPLRHRLSIELDELRKIHAKLHHTTAR